MSLAAVAYDDAPQPRFGRAIGVMSGTSCDGVDAIMLDLEAIDTPHLPTVLARSALAFDAALSEELRHPEQLSCQRICELHFLLPELYATAVRRLPNYQQAKVVGVHGQTIWHQTGPQARRRGTLQIGSSSALAQHLNCPTVGDLRAADVALGGLGAPIVPLAHWFFTAGTQRQAVIVNFGGMCNLTYVSPQLNDVVAYDVGPGMVLSDAFAHFSSHGRLSCDLDGQLSADGKLIPALLRTLVEHPYVKLAPPKSTGREDFGAAYAAALFQQYAAQHSHADMAYTLLVATLHILHLHITADPRIQANRLILTGGGALNPTLLREAHQRFVGWQVQVEVDGVFAPQNHEPAAMALIAARTLQQLPSSLPQVTGASRASILGTLAYP